jgi:D-alanyl-D-alanine dipeptidase
MPYVEFRTQHLLIYFIIMPETVNIYAESRAKGKIFMPVSFGEPLTKLRAVPIRENGEPLVDPTVLSSRIEFLATHPRFPDMPRTPNVRKTVAEKLAMAADSLPAGIVLVIVQGFRPLAQQRFLYEEVKKRFVEEHPDWSRATLHRIVNTLCAPPEDRCPPPHSTGGAVDVALRELMSAENMDMVSPYEFNEKSAPTAVKGLSETAATNRKLLVDALSSTGLTNYIGEWWHWSWGDSGWALRVGAPNAHYDRLPEAGK